MVPLVKVTDMCNKLIVKSGKIRGCMKVEQSPLVFRYYITMAITPKNDFNYALPYFV